MMDFISAILLLPMFCLMVYATERVLDRIVQKHRRAEKLRIIHMRRLELESETNRCA